MSEAAKNLLELALKLSAAERELLAQSLLQSVADPSVEAAWIEESRRRKADPNAKFVDARQLIAELQARQGSGR